jgi:hypothetical protein
MSGLRCSRNWSLTSPQDSTSLNRQICPSNCRKTAIRGGGRANEPEHGVAHYDCLDQRRSPLHSRDLRRRREDAPVGGSKQQVERVPLAAENYLHPRLSPDDRRLAIRLKARRELFRTTATGRPMIGVRMIKDDDQGQGHVEADHRRPGLGR